MKNLLFASLAAAVLLSCNNVELTKKYKCYMVIVEDSIPLFEINYPDNWEAMEEEPDVVNTYFQAYLFYDPKIKIPQKNGDLDNVLSLVPAPLLLGTNPPANWIDTLYVYAIRDNKEHKEDYNENLYTEIRKTKLGNYDCLWTREGLWNRKGDQYTGAIFDDSTKMFLEVHFRRTEDCTIDIDMIEDILSTLVLKGPLKEMPPSQPEK